METGETVGRKIALILVRADGGLDQGDGDDAKEKLTHLGDTWKAKETSYTNLNSMVLAQKQVHESME